MKKLVFIFTLIFIGLISFAQTDTIKVWKGKKLFKPDVGFGQDTLQAWTIQNKNSGGNAGFTVIVGTDTMILRLDSSGFFRIDSASVVVSDTIETKTGYKFPDGTFQNTSATSLTFSQILSNGNTSSGNNAIMSVNDELRFAGASQGVLRSDGSIFEIFSTNADLNVTGGTGSGNLNLGSPNMIDLASPSIRIGVGTSNFVRIGASAAALTKLTIQSAAADTYISQFITSSSSPVMALREDGSIGISTITPDASSIFDITSTTRGFLVPRMTTEEQDAISAPTTGLLIFNTDFNSFHYYETSWKHIGNGGGIYAGSDVLSGNTTVTLGSNVLTLSGDPAGGVLLNLTNTGIGNSDALITSSGGLVDLTSNGDLGFAVGATAHDATPDMFLDNTNNGLGIGNITPAGLLDVSSLTVVGTPSTSGQYMSFSASTFTDNNTVASGTAAVMVFNSIASPILTASELTVTTTDAATFYIAGEPIEGTNMTITNPYSLWVDTGIVRIDESIELRGAKVDSIIQATGFTGNLGNSTTGADTLFTSALSTDELLVNGTFNYSVDAQADDDYEVDIPAITVLTEGLMVTFKANTANTGAVTLEITGVGDLDAILKLHDQALATGDIEAGQIVVVVFDGTDWQMISQIAQ